MTQAILTSAELSYSNSRLAALCDEWRANYPNLNVACEFLKGCSELFTIDQLNNTVYENRIADIFSDLHEKECPIYSIFESAFTPRDFKEVLADLFHIIYSVGVLGIQKNDSPSIYYSFYERNVSLADFAANTNKLYVHPAFHEALQIKKLFS